MTETITKNKEIDAGQADEKSNCATWLQNSLKELKTRNCHNIQKMKSKRNIKKFNVKNTCNADKSTSFQFQQYLKQINEHIEFWNLTPSELDAHLSNYWFVARSNKIDPVTGEFAEIYDTELKIDSLWN